MPVLSTITHETDENGFMVSEKFVTDGGLKMEIRPAASGLYEIGSLGGGNPPPIVNERFTSHLRAREALIRYLNDTDRLGYAVHPDKPEEVTRKRKNRDGTIKE